MRRTVFEFLKEIATELQLFPDQSVTSFSDTNLRGQLLYYLNRAKDWALSDVDIETLLQTVVFSTSAIVNAGTVSITQGTTNLVGVATAWTSDDEGKKIRIAGASVNYVIAKVRSTTSLELAQPFYNDTVSGVAYTMFQDVYSLPCNVRNVAGVVRQDTRRTLQKRAMEFMITRYPDPTMYTSLPLFWGEFGVKDTKTETYTSDTATTTTAIYSGLNSTVYNFYKDWEFFNVTRNTLASVLSYDNTTTTITLDQPITGQTSGDTFYLRKREKQIMIRPVTYSIVPMTVICNKYPSKFINDTDMETEIPEDFELMLFHRAVAEYYMAKSPEKAPAYAQAAQQFLDQWKSILENMPIAGLEFGGGRSIAQQDAWYYGSGSGTFSYQSNS